MIFDVVEFGSFLLGFFKGCLGCVEEVSFRVEVSVGWGEWERELSLRREVSLGGEVRFRVWVF